ncbi:hypothetical protein N7475_003039 [Penicillium sp. IBT 31633x]|nr:hypothetical protein N7475_003039 [Penicillium sp. IBT 31633x]
MPPSKDRYDWIKHAGLTAMEIVHLILAVVCFNENSGMVKFEILASRTNVLQVIAKYVFHNGRSKLRRHLGDQSGAQRDAAEATIAASTKALKNVEYVSIKGIKLAPSETEHLLLGLVSIDEATGVALRGANQAETDKPSATDVACFDGRKEVFWSSVPKCAWKMWVEKHAELQNLWGFSNTKSDLENFWIWYKVIFYYEPNA